jgi:hypothetical protein
MMKIFFVTLLQNLDFFEFPTNRVIAPTLADAPLFLQKLGATFKTLEQPPKHASSIASKGKRE